MPELFIETPEVETEEPKEKEKEEPSPEAKEDYKGELHRKFVAFLEPFKTAGTKFEDSIDEATLYRDVPVPREQLAHLSYAYPQKRKEVYVLNTTIGANFIKTLNSEKYNIETTESGWFIKPKE